MTTPDKPVWERDPHTEAKHQLIQRYLQAWLPKLLSGWKSVTYIEGFAGPGVYEKGEPGSPVIAYGEIRKQLAGRTDRRVNVVLIEERRDRREILKNQMAKAGAPVPAAPVSYPEGKCADKLIGALDQTAAFGNPIFALLDSWGGPLPFELLPPIAANKSSEVLITFGPRYLVQFGTGAAQKAAGDRAFGSTQWHGVFAQPAEEKYSYLVTAYRASLREAGFAYSLSFELLDETGSELHLVFGTNSLEGLRVMKDAMWKVDQIRGAQYRDPRDPVQEALNIQAEPGIGPLRRELLAHLRNCPEGMTLRELQDFTLRETIYRPPHATEAVKSLISAKLAQRAAGGPLSLTTTVRLAPAEASKPSQGELF